MESRALILLIVELVFAISISTSHVATATGCGMTILLAVLYRNTLRHAGRTLAAGFTAVTALSLVTFLLGGSVRVAEAADGLFRLASITVLGVVLFMGATPHELAVGLARLGLPVGVAIAMAVGLRFTPLLIEDSRHVLAVLSVRWETNPQRISAVRRLGTIASVLIVAAIRRAEALTLAVTVQDLPHRLRAHRGRGWRPIEYAAMLLGATAVLVSLLF